MFENLYMVEKIDLLNNVLIVKNLRTKESTTLEVSQDELFELNEELASIRADPDLNESDRFLLIEL